MEHRALLGRPAPLSGVVWVVSKKNPGAWWRNNWNGILLFESIIVLIGENNVFADRILQSETSCFRLKTSTDSLSPLAGHPWLGNGTNYVGLKQRGHQQGCKERGDGVFSAER